MPGSGSRILRSVYGIDYNLSKRILRSVCGIKRIVSVPGGAGAGSAPGSSAKVQTDALSIIQSVKMMVMHFLVIQEAPLQ